MSTIIDSIEQRQRRRIPRFAAGDRVRVHFQVIEGTRKRTQVFEGVVIKRQGSGLRETFTVRKQSFGVGVERMFPLHSPKIEQLEIAARGDVRRAKLYYLRDRVGKAARVAERRWGIEEDLLGAEEEGAVDAEGVSQEELAEAADVDAEVAEAAEDGSAAQTEGESAAGPVAADDSADSPGDGKPAEPTTTPPAEEAAPAGDEALSEEDATAGEQAPAEEPAEEGEPEHEASGEGDVEPEEPAEATEKASD